MSNFIEFLQFKLGGWYLALVFILISTVFAIPIFIYWGLGSPDNQFWLVIISLALFGILGAIIIGALIYQFATNSDISKAPWFIKLFGKW